MHRAIVAIAFAILASSASAQNVSFEAVRLADTFTAATLKDSERSWPTLVAGIESQMKSMGATEQASKAFANELRISFSRENLTRAVAQVITENLSDTEIKELHAFMQSSVGKKYLRLHSELSNTPKYVVPMLRQACTAASNQLEGRDRESIISLCGQI